MPRSRRAPQQALDRVVLGLMAGLVIVAVLLIALGDHATVRVQEFSWQDRTIGAENGAFILSFNRPMDTASVEANLAITPLVPGRVSWAGRRMAYTLNVPVPYGQAFTVGLSQAQDRFADGEDTRFESFAGTFQSRDRAMAYIGTQGDEKDRLVLVNFSEAPNPVILTPTDLKVLAFEPYPLGDGLLFSAVKANAPEAEMLAPALYKVATGIQPNPPEALQTDGIMPPVMVAAEAGTLTPVLGSDIYQNLAFDLSPDGRTIVLQRVNRTDPADFGPWILRAGADPRPLETEPGGEFLIAPDSQTLLMLQGQGTAVIPLNADPDAEETTANQPLDFLPEFGRVFDISSDGTAAAMVDFNQNDPERRFTESLVIVTNQGEEQELLNVTGSILNAQFDPTNQLMYVLASELLPGETYQEQPFLAAINLETQEPLKLLSLPPQSQISMSLAPDGLDALLEVAVPNASNPDAVGGQTLLLNLFESPQALSTGIFSRPESPQLLPYEGLSPTWLP